MSMRPRIPCLLLCCGLAAYAEAGQIYKWVDDSGHVTYSSSPPPPGAQVEKLTVPPPPTQEEMSQARERAQRDEEQARALENRRREQEAARKAEEARLKSLQESQQPVVIEKRVPQQPNDYYPVNPRPGTPADRPRPKPVPR